MEGVVPGSVVNSHGGSHRHSHHRSHDDKHGEHRSHSGRHGTHGHDSSGRQHAPNLAGLVRDTPAVLRSHSSDQSSRRSAHHHDHHSSPRSEHRSDRHSSDHHRPGSDHRSSHHSSHHAPDRHSSHPHHHSGHDSSHASDHVHRGHHARSHTQPVREERKGRYAHHFPDQSGSGGGGGDGGHSPRGTGGSADGHSPRSSGHGRHKYSGHHGDSDHQKQHSNSKHAHHASSRSVHDYGQFNAMRKMERQQQPTHHAAVEMLRQYPTKKQAEELSKEEKENQLYFQQRRAELSETFSKSNYERALRYRNLTCPRKKTTLESENPDGSKKTIVKYQLWSIWKMSIEQLEQYGLGLMSYFKFLKHLTLMFLLWGFVMLMPLILNVSAGNGDETTNRGYHVEKTTLGNLGEQERLIQNNETVLVRAFNYDFSRNELGYIYSSLNVFAVVCFLIFLKWQQRVLRRDNLKYAKKQLTIVHYTVQVEGLPTYFRDRIALRDFFQARFGPVVEVAIAYNDHDLIKAYNKRGQQRKMLASAQAFNNRERIDEMVRTIKRTDQDIALIKRTLDKKTVAAFVTFESQASRIKAVEAYPDGMLSRWRQPEYLRLRKLYPLRVIQAPEPSNILFHHLKYSSKEKFLHRTVTFFAAVLLLLVSITIVYLAQRFQRQNPQPDSCPDNITPAQANSGSSTLKDCFCSRAGIGLSSFVGGSSIGDVDCSDYLKKLLYSRLLTFLSVITIVAVNYILKWLAKRLGRWEKHSSLTAEQRAVTVKLFIGLFLNTGMVLLLVNADLNYALFDFGVRVAFDGQFKDFTAGWFNVVGTSLLFTMVLKIFNPQIQPLAKMAWLKCKREKCTGKVVDANKLQKLYSGDFFDLSERYAVLLNTLFVTLFYGAGMPLIYIFAAASFFCTFWFDKTSFLRLYAIPPRYDTSSSELALGTVPYAIMIHLALAIWFYTGPLLSNSDTWTDGVSLDNVPDSSVSSRLKQAHIFPVLLLLCLMVAWYLVITPMWSFFMCRCCSNKRSTKLDHESRRFYSYSEACKMVKLESYYVHKQHRYLDAFIRTPSGKQLFPQQSLRPLQKAEQLASEDLEPEKESAKATAKAKAGEAELHAQTPAERLVANQRRAQIEHKLHVQKKMLRDQVYNGDNEQTHATITNTVARKQAEFDKLLEVDGDAHVLKDSDKAMLGFLSTGNEDELDKLTKHRARRKKREEKRKQREEKKARGEEERRSSEEEEEDESSSDEEKEHHHSHVEEEGSGRDEPSVSAREEKKLRRLRPRRSGGVTHVEEHDEQFHDGTGVLPGQDVENTSLDAPIRPGSAWGLSPELEKRRRRRRHQRPRTAMERGLSASNIELDKEAGHLLVEVNCPSCLYWLQVVDTGQPREYSCPVCHATFAM